MFNIFPVASGVSCACTFPRSRTQDGWWIQIKGKEEKVRLLSTRIKRRSLPLRDDCGVQFRGGRAYLQEVEWRSLRSSGTSSRDRSWTIFCRCHIDRRAGRELGGTNNLDTIRTCRRNTPVRRRSEPSGSPRPPHQHPPRCTRWKKRDA